ncbi:MAG TPA: hypothetical protein VI815_02495 [Candidatus Nanoarchaeia archaeon]|nr:hypothetical protein [Candidatus Nanoarchaeia archaeon]
MDQNELLKFKLRESVETINKCHTLLDKINMPRTSRDNKMFSLEERISILVDIKNDQIKYSIFSKFLHKLRTKLYI